VDDDVASKIRQALPMIKTPTLIAALRKVNGFGKAR